MLRPTAKMSTHEGEHDGASKEASVGGAPHHDPAFEFCAPMFYDFQRMNDNVPSPASQGEGYFESSKTKGMPLCKPDKVSLLEFTSKV